MTMQGSFKPHKLKALRVFNKLSQEGLAKKVGLSRPTIQRLEAGLTLKPSITTLQALAEAFDISFSALFTDEVVSIQ